jgi:hypothetical protein
MKGRPKIMIVRRKVLAVAGCAVAAVLMFCVVHSPAAVGAYATQRQLPIYCVEKDYKVASLSFDAAWGNEDTQQLIDILGKYKVRATFFVVGDWVEKYPESVKALHDAGHEIMNHSDDHAHFNSLSTTEIVANITACNEKIAEVTGVTPTLFRPPYGEYDDHVVAAVRSMDMEPVQWDVDVLERVGVIFLACITIQNAALFFDNVTISPFSSAVKVWDTRSGVRAFRLGQVPPPLLRSRLLSAILLQKQTFYCKEGHPCQICCRT